MFKTAFKIAWRNLLKDRQFTLLNLIGLSTGLACALLIYLWINDEWHFDKFNENDEQIFQVMSNQENANGTRTMEATPGILARTLKEEMPEVEYAAATIYPSWTGETTLSVKDNNMKAVGYYVDKDYFNIFSYRLIQGNKDKVLADKNAVVISKNLAMKLFNTTENVVGRTIEWQHEKQYLISGIFEPLPHNSSAQFDYLLSFDVYLDNNPYLKLWGNNDPNTYLVLKKGVDIERFNRKIAGFIKSKQKDANITLFVRRFSDAYLYNRYENGVLAGGRIEYVRMFTIIAIFILVIACINFMNLSTAKASKRLKEVGIKKVVGATRQMLVFQYLGESILITFLSLMITILLVYLLLPGFNNITGKQLMLQLNGGLILSVLGITLFTGLLAGSYPALYLSGFNPAAILKGKLRTSIGELWVRKGLVVFQFVISVVFIIAVLVVYRQTQLIQTKNPGYNLEHTISFDLGGTKSLDKTTAFLAAIKNMPGIVNASSMDHSSIVEDFGTTSDVYWEGKQPDEVIQFGNIGVNYGMLETLGMEIVAGRSFSSSISSDSSEIIFNEAAIKSMELKDPVGKTVRMWGKNRKIVGIVKNFHFESLHESVKPFALRLEPLETYRIVAKIAAGKDRETINRLEDAYEKYNPGFPFDYRFLNNDYQQQYITETRIAVLSKYFAGLAILISCLGLFGLAAFTAQRRHKEIGIRKVLGASESSVAVMLSKDFLKLVLIAVFIAFPLAWWAMNQWLNDFAYRIRLGVDIFLIAGLSTILITILTISFQAIRASLIDPVKSLKTE